MDLEVLLAPIAPDTPCGVDLSFSAAFDHIADMRREDDPTLDQGEWVTTLKVADWPGVAEQCQSLLESQTKDLRVAMWLTEAWTLTQGYPGLSNGLQLCTALCRRYWPSVHPQADDGDQEERIGNMSWLLQRVVALSDTLPVTQGRHGTAFTLRDLQIARQQAAVAERAPDDTAKDAHSKVTLDQFNRALRDTPATHLRTALDGLQASLRHLQDWQGVIDEQLGAAGPSFVAAKESLAKAEHELTRLGREAGALMPAAQPAADQPNGHTDTPSESTGHMAASSTLYGRAQALQQLREVAQFFRRTEPHSPVAYLVDKAVKWGDMPLHEWLREVVKEQGAMSHIQELLGLAPVDPPAY